MKNRTFRNKKREIAALKTVAAKMELSLNWLSPAYKLTKKFCLKSFPINMFNSSIEIDKIPIHATNYASRQVFLEWRQKRQKRSSCRTFYTDMNIIEITKEIILIKLL